VKLIIAVVHDTDARKVMDALLAREIRFTRIGSTGGFLREGNTTLLIGAQRPAIEDVLEAVRANCQTREQYASVSPPDPAMVGALLGAPV